MAKRNKIKHADSVVEKEPVVEKVVEPYNKYVLIQSLIDSRLIYDGEITGRHYEWSRSGETQPVDERDAPALLKKRIGERSCCGENMLGNKVFDVYK